MKDGNFQHILGHIIREERQKYNYTQEQLAEKANLDANNLSRIERGEQIPSTITLFKLMNTLQIDFLQHLEVTDKALKQDEED